VIALQAGVAAHVIDRDPARAKDLLRTMAATPAGKHWTGCGPTWTGCAPRPGSAARAPGPGLADLPLLLDRMRGLTVST
jgi:hypothetical protein